MDQRTYRRMVADRDALAGQLAKLEAAIETIKRYAGRPETAAEPGNGAATKRKGRAMTAAQRKAVGVRMRRYWRERRKAAKP